MVATGTLIALLIASLASLFMAWAIGAGSSGSTPFAPAVGANVISVMRAGFVVGILGLLGAVLQGANVTETVGRGLVLFPADGGLTATAAVVALVTAATLVAIGVFAGYPIATAFTVTGAVVGVGLALGGAPAWETYGRILGLWIATPFVGGGIAFLTAKMLRDERVPEAWAIPILGGLVGLIVANVDLALLGSPGESASVTVATAAVLTGSGSPLGPTTRLPIRVAVSCAVGLVSAGVLEWDLRRDKRAGQRHFLLALGALVAFSAGGSQVGLALGPLLPLLDDLGQPVPLGVVLFGGGVGLLLGSWTGAPRMIKALAQDYSSLGPRRSIAALIPSFAIAQTAVLLGLPVSFNEIIVSAIVGSGFAAGGQEVSGRKMGYTVVAWTGSLILAGVAGFVTFRGVALLL